MRSRCVRHLERCFHRLASSTSTPLYARPAFLVAPLTSQRQAECHSFRVGSHGRGLSTGIPTPEPNDDKEQLREPKKKETQGLKHTNLAQSEPTAAGGKDELRAEKHEGAAQEDDPVLSSKLRAVDTPLEGKQSAQENTEENNSLYDASLSHLAGSNKVQRARITALENRLLGFHHLTRAVRRELFAPSLLWLYMTISSDSTLQKLNDESVSQFDIAQSLELGKIREHLRHAFLMAQKLLRTGDAKAARQMLTPRLQEAFAHVYSSYAANGLSFRYEEDGTQLELDDVILDRAFPRDFMAGTLDMLRKEHHAAFLTALKDEDAKVALGLQERGEVREDSHLWPFLEMVGVTRSMLKNDTVQSGCSVKGLCWLVLEARYDAVVTCRVYNRSGQLVLEHTDERPNFYQFVRGPVKGPTGFAWIPEAARKFLSHYLLARPHRLQSDCTPWRLACVGGIQSGKLVEV